MTTIPTDLIERRKRDREAVRLHEIESNPFTDEENRTFEMFDREGWTDEQCRAYLLERIGKRAERVEAAE